MDMQKDTGLWDIISEIEGDAASLEDVIYSMVLFDEALGNAVRWIDPSKPYTAETFIKRFELLSAMLNMLQRELGQFNTALHANIANAYEIRFQTKEGEHSN